MTLKIFIQLSFFISLAFGSLNYPRCTNINNAATVLTSLNGQVQGSCYRVTGNYGGYKPNINKNVLTWLGVPYAQPPIGNLRFKNPVPVQSWRNRRGGTAWSYACTQMDNSGVSKYSSEDCLYLNIFVPYDVYLRSVVQNSSLSRVPVYIGVHGGSNIVGASYE